MKRIILLLILSVGMLNANAQCNFTYTMSGNTASFSHAWPSIYQVDSLHFNYGDGSPTNVISPYTPTSTHTYNNSSPGIFWTCMTAYMSSINQPGVIVCTYCDSVLIGGTQSCTVSVNASASGSTISTTASASGGVPPYTYSYNLMPGNVTNTTGTFSGLANGVYTVCVTSYDANQALCSIGCDSIYVGSQVFCTTSLQTSLSGNTITSIANSTGGTGPYTYSYNLMPGNITNSTGTFSGLANGTYVVCVTSTDANNVSCAQTCNTLVIGTAPGPCATTLTASATGNTVNASATASFGTPPYTYSYTLNPGNITNSTGTFTGLANGLYTVCATATDSNNQICTPDCDSIFVGNTVGCQTTITTGVNGNTITALATSFGGTPPYTYSYNLMPGNITNSTGTFSGLANGTYVVCATSIDANNMTCTQACNTVVIGNQGPCATTLTTSGSGTTITASATASFGQPPYTYSYTLNPGSITNSTGLFTGLTPGTYTVCATATDSLLQTCTPDCDSVILSGNFFCTTSISVSASGNTVTALGSAIGGTGPYTYSYNLNPGNITNSTGVFSGLANGPYTVCVTAIDANQTTCSIACDSTFVSSSTGCVSSISSSVSGNTLTAIGSAIGGTGPYTYSYTLNPGNITNATGIFSGLANGFYGVCVTAYDAMQNVCSIACDSAYVGNTIGGCAINVSFSEVITGLNVNFTDGSTITNGTITNYNWSFGDGNISTTASPSHTYAASGPYNVVLVVNGIDSNQSPCVDSFSKVITVQGPNAVNSVQVNKLSIYPNPTTKNITIDLPLNEKVESLVLTDVSGRIIPTEYKKIGGDKLSISLKNNAAGIYFIKLQTDANFYTSSIMKQE